MAEGRGLLGRAVRSESGDDLLDVSEMLDLLRRDLADQRKQRGARGLELMQEVAELVLLQPPDVFGHDAIRWQVTHLEGVRVEVFPVLDRDPARVEQLE